MILNYIIMKNFRTFTNKRIEFNNGTIGIIGNNGSGKSTIFEAVLWVLFGNNASRTNVDGIRNSTSNIDAPVSVALAFEKSGHQYIITRSVKGKSNTPSASIIINDTTVANSSAAVTKYVTKLLNDMDYQSFISSVFAKQSELAALSNTTPAARVKLIQHMLGVDAIDKAIVSIRADSRQKKSNVSAKELLLAPDGIDKTSQLLGEQEQVTKDIKVLTENKTTTEKTLSDLKEIYNQTNNTITSYTRLANQANALKLKRAPLNEKINTNIQYASTLRDKIAEFDNNDIATLLKAENRHKELAQQVATITAALPAINEFNDVTKDLKTAGTHARELAQKYSESLGEYDSLEKIKAAHDTIQAKITELTPQIDATTTELSDLKAKLKIAQNNLTAAAETLSKIEEQGADSICPTCERVMGEQYITLKEKYLKEHLETKETIHELTGQINTLEKSKNIIIDTKNQCNISLSTLAIQIDKTATIETAITEIEKSITHLKCKHDELAATVPTGIDHTQLPKLATELRELEPKHQKYIKYLDQKEQRPVWTEELNIVDSAADTLKRELQTIDTELETIQLSGFSEELLAATRAKSNTEANQIKQTEITISQLTEKITAKKDRMEWILKSLAELDTICTSIAEERKDIELLERLVNDKNTGLIQAFRTHVISHIRPQLAARASEIMQAMTDGIYSKIELDDEYNISLYDMGMPHQIERFSGGEQDLANLSLRLALAKLISSRHGSEGIGFVALDEVFASLDSNRRGLVMSSLSGLSRQFKQVFMITHADELKDGFDQTIMLGKYNE